MNLTTIGAIASAGGSAPQPAPGFSRGFGPTEGAGGSDRVITPALAADGLQDVVIRCHWWRASAMNAGSFTRLMDWAGVVTIVYAPNNDTLRLNWTSSGTTYRFDFAPAPFDQWLEIEARWNAAVRTFSLFYDGVPATGGFSTGSGVPDAVNGPIVWGNVPSGSNCTFGRLDNCRVLVNGVLASHVPMDEEPVDLVLGPLQIVGTRLLEPA